MLWPQFFDTLIPDFMNSLGLADAMAIMATTSFITYLLFHYFEPQKPAHLTVLLVIIPIVLTVLFQSSMPSLLVVIPLSVICHNALILFLVTTYRLSPFHPLAKYPGPIPNRISKLWMSYICRTGKQHIYCRKLHEKYGDIVRIGPNELSINRADAIEPILGVTGLRRGPYWSNRAPDGVVVAVIGQLDPVEHQRRRKPWVRAFNTAALKIHEEAIIGRSRELIEQLEKRANEMVDLNLWMSYFTFDFMGDIVFGANFEMMHNGYDARGIWHRIEQKMTITAMAAHAPWAFRLLRLISPFYPDPMILIAKELVGHRVQQGSKTKDLFYHLMGEGDSENTRSVTYSDGLLAIIAGSDTTATAAVALMYYLLCDVTAFNRLRVEIDQNFPQSEEPINFSKMASMPYLNACINEALRLFPPVPGGSQRRTHTGSGGKLIGPYFIPEGNNLFVHTYTLHRNPQAFSPFPDSFWPDRWLPESDRKGGVSSSEFVHDSIAFQPFSFGPENCVGKNVALMELRIVACSLVKNFDFRFKEGFDSKSWEMEAQDYFTVIRQPLPVVVQVRKKYDDLDRFV